MDERTLSEAAICIHSISSCSLTHSTQQYRTCGTHFGCTNEPASIVFRPVLARRFTNSILVSAGILVFSFCRPSLGPTSTIRTWSANARREEVKLRVKLGMQSRLTCRLRSGDGGMMERIGRIRRAHGAGTLFAVSHQRRRCFQMFSKLVDVQGYWSRRH